MPFLVKVCNINVISMTKMYSETTPQNSNFEEKNPMTCPNPLLSIMRIDLISLVGVWEIYELFECWHQLNP